MKDLGFGEPFVDEPLCSPPLEAILLAASPERAQPEAHDVLEKCTECRPVCRDGMVGKVAFDNLPQPLTLFRDRLVHASPQFLLDFFELCPQSFALGFPPDDELPPTATTANQGKP